MLLSSFGRTYTKIGTIQRRLAWPLCKDDTQNLRSVQIFSIISSFKSKSSTILSSQASIMNSLEWRVKKLENKLIGQTNNLVHVDRILGRQAGVTHDSILDQLELIAKQYKSFLDVNGPNYTRFVELYDKYKALLSEFDTRQDNDVSSKAELVLAYEDELKRYMENSKTMAETADRVLNVEKWPDLSGYEERLNKLQTIIKGQHIQSTTIDKRTEELIELYNEIIVSFKRNSSLWNQKLEAYENEEKEPDEDV